MKMWPACEWCVKMSGSVDVNVGDIKTVYCKCAISPYCRRPKIARGGTVTFDSLGITAGRGPYDRSRGETSNGPARLRSDQGEVTRGRR